MSGVFQRFIRQKDGTTAIEFSLLLLPYMMISLAIIELSLLFASASLLEGATDSAARMIKTGELQQSGAADPEGSFRTALCQFAVVLIDCNDVIIEVSPITSFADYTGPTLDADGNVVTSGFNAGGSNDIVMVRVAYTYTMMTPFVGPLLNGTDGETLFVSTVVMQTEPYEFEG